ncbi:MAG TPA: DUF4065 domain-containing protein [bacterium]|nr:DUF4065 domain-containing protein [bacterium]
MNSLTKHIRYLRDSKSFSQEYVADIIGVSRPTYVQIEKGERELTVSEVKKLAALYEMDISDLLMQETPTRKKITLDSKQPTKKAKEPSLRISVPQKNIEKFKEVLLYILGKVGAKPNIGETAIYKLLYFIDFDYYEKYEEQLIGATYIHNHFGPTPVEFQAITDKMKVDNELTVVTNKYFQYDQKKYLPLRPAKLVVLNAQEKALIDDVLARLSDKSATELSEYSHGDIPWKIHAAGEVIEYDSVFYRDREYTVRNLDDEL